MDEDFAPQLIRLMRGESAISEQDQEFSLYGIEDTEYGKEGVNASNMTHYNFHFKGPLNVDQFDDLD